MKYFVLLAGYGELEPFEEMSAEAQQTLMEKFGAFDAACRERDGVELLGGEALEGGSMATTMRTRGGELTITDGPFAESTEHIGGYYLMEAPDLDTVTSLCSVLPAYDIEIRPVIDMG